MPRCCSGWSHIYVLFQDKASQTVNITFAYETLINIFDSWLGHKITSAITTVYIAGEIAEEFVCNRV